MTVPTRPILRWHGGKWRLAPWVIRHFPKHRIYVEPFGGAASVLLRKPRAYAEVYNDLDDQVVNLFRVAQRQGDELVRQLRLVPYSYSVFNEAFRQGGTELDQAIRLVCRSFMGFGSNGHNKVTSFRCNSNRTGTIPAHDWANYPECLQAIIERIRGVVIECRPAAKVMFQHDSTETLTYLDPPYLPETRGKGGDYAVELTVQDHIDLLHQARDLEGMVVLSGYPASIYDELLHDWMRVSREAYADGARKRTECLWLNPACANALRGVGQMDIFEVPA